jgi:hypothetical protein
MGFFVPEMRSERMRDPIANIILWVAYLIAAVATLAAANALLHGVDFKESFGFGAFVGALTFLPARRLFYILTGR